MSVTIDKFSMKKDFRGKKGFKGGGFVKRRFEGGERPEMHDATCGQCGADCQVPFKPMGKRPVLCNACFHKDDFGGAPKRFEKRSFRSEGPSMFDHAERFERSERTSDMGIEKRLRVIEEKLDVIFQVLTDDQI
jgi:CxxC-x17-CxxC domain-containing protein